MDDMQRIMQMAPVETGNMTDIPPDAPPGIWLATCHAAPSLTDEGHLRIKLSWSLDEAMTSGNEDFAGRGKRVFDIPITFYPSGHAKKRSGWHERRLRDVCNAVGVDVPTSTTWTGKAFVAFVGQLDGQKCQLSTRIEVDQETGEQRARVEFPRKSASLKAATTVDDDDDEEEEAPPAPVKLGPNGRPLKKKSK